MGPPRRALAVGALALMAGALCFTAASAAAAAAPASPYPAVELTPSVMLLGEFDWVPEYPGAKSSRCTNMVDRAVKYGSSRINFVPTHYYREDSKGINGYCYMDRNYTSCVDFSKAGIQSFRAGLAMCFAHAAAAGIREIAITPHIDSASAGKTWTIKAWRNGIVFSPVKSYSGFSYVDIMLRPLADVLGASVPTSTVIYFALQGEMGATLFRYPAEYQQLLVDMREVVQEARARNAWAEAPLAPAPAPAPAAAATASATRRSSSSSSYAAASSRSRTSTSFPLWSDDTPADDTPSPDDAGFPFLFTSTTGRRVRDPYRIQALGMQQGGDAAATAALPPGALQGVQQTLENPTTGRVRMGITMNFIFIDGNQAPDNDSSKRYSNMFRLPIAFGGVLWSRLIAPFLGMRSSGGQDAPPFSKPAVQSLFKAVDFIGISAYSPLKVDFKINQLQNSAFNWMDEASAATGLDMAKVVKDRGIELQYAEYGVGGGSSDGGNAPATSPANVAAQPYWGVTGPYKKRTDPWQDTQLKHFMRSFYSRTLDWLSQGGGPTYPISALYMWNLASWDVLGIYPESTTADGSYVDQVVASMVTQHNNGLH